MKTLLNLRKFKSTFCCLVIIGLASLTVPVCAQVQLQGELVPFRANTPSAQPSSETVPTSIQHQNVLSQLRGQVPKQYSQSGFSTAPSNPPDLGSLSPQQRPQDSQRRSEQNAIEALPSPLNLGDEEGENVIIQRYDNGQPQIVRHVTKDSDGHYYNDGPWEVRSQTGLVVARGTYQLGRMHGQWDRIHDAKSSDLFSTKPFNLFQGPYKSIAQFREGKLHGAWIIEDQYGTKIFEIFYTDGVRDGIATWYLPNQARMREATFKSGLLDGDILEFDDAEKVAGRQTFIQGRKIVRNTTYYRPNAKKSEEYFLAAKLEPQDSDNWWDAQPTPYRTTGSQVQDGSAKSWYENGQPKQRGQFKEGQPIGLFTQWHANGNKQFEGNYVDGKKDQRWTWWHENGMKQFEGRYQDDQPAGVWRAWNADGKLRKEKDYSQSTSMVNQPANLTEPDASQSTTEPDAAQSSATPDAEAEEDRSVLSPITIKPLTKPATAGAGEPSTIPAKLPAPPTDTPSTKASEELENIAPMEPGPTKTPDEKAKAPPLNGPKDEESSEDNSAIGGQMGLLPPELYESTERPKSQADENSLSQKKDQS